MPPEDPKPLADPVDAAPTPWSLMKKRRRGEALTQAERKILADYHKPYSRNRSPQYLSRAELEDWSRLAEKAGMRLNPWMRRQVHRSLQDRTPAERALEEDLARITAERNNLRQQVGDLAYENTDLTRKGESIADELRVLTKKWLEWQGQQGANA